MFLRCKVRRRDGKQHRYWSVVENTRVAGARVVQRHVLYLGEINDTQELAWRRSIEVLEEGALQPRTLSLFPETAAPECWRTPRSSTSSCHSCSCARPTAVGRMLVRAAAVARAGARSVLVEAVGRKPQRDAVGSGPVRAGCLSLAGAGQPMAAAPRVVSAQCPGRSAGRGRRAGRNPQAVPLSRPAAGAQAGGL